MGPLFICIMFFTSVHAQNWQFQRLFDAQNCGGNVVFMSFVPSSCTLETGTCMNGGGGSSRVDCVATMPTVQGLDTTITFSSTNTCTDVTGVYAGNAGLCMQLTATDSQQFSCPSGVATLTSFSASPACSGASTSFGGGTNCGPIQGGNGIGKGTCPSSTTAPASTTPVTTTDSAPASTTPVTTTDSAPASTTPVTTTDSAPASTTPVTTTDSAPASTTPVTTTPPPATVPAAADSVSLTLGYSSLPTTAQDIQIINYMSQLTTFPVNGIRSVSQSTRSPTVVYSLTGTNAGSAANMIDSTVRTTPNYFANQTAGLPIVTSSRVSSGGVRLALVLSNCVVAFLLLLLLL